MVGWVPRRLSQRLHFRRRGIRSFPRQNDSATRWQQSRLKFPNNLAKVEYFLSLSGLSSVQKTYDDATSRHVTVVYFVAVSCYSLSSGWCTTSRLWFSSSAFAKHWAPCQCRLSGLLHRTNNTPVTSNDVLPAYKETTANFS